MTQQNDPLEDEATDPLKIRLLEETATVSKREVVTGRVRISTTAEHVEEVARAVLQSEAVDITRVPIDRVVDVAPTIRTEGEVTVIPILEEIMVVEKRLVLKEELHIRRTRTEQLVEQPISLRRQRADIERETTEAGDRETGPD